MGGRRVLEVLDADAVRRWYRSGLAALEATRAEIDSLNVFPVADADTGYQPADDPARRSRARVGARRSRARVGARRRRADGVVAFESADLAETVTTIARRCLLGARGSSGVILSQLLRGIAEVLAAQPGRPTVEALAAGFERAVVLAYAAVAQPVEGTMLTVAREAAEAARGSASDGLAHRRCRCSAGVRATHWPGRPRNSTSWAVPASSTRAAAGSWCCSTSSTRWSPSARSCCRSRDSRRPRLDPCESVDGPSPAYEVMYLIDTDDARVPALRAALDEIGEAVVVSGGDGLWNVHVHTDDAPAAVELGVAAGRPHDVRVTEIGDPRDLGGSPDGAELAVRSCCRGRAGRRLRCTADLRSADPIGCVHRRGRGAARAGCVRAGDPRRG